MLKIAKLRCEYRENPIGIDVMHPRISWLLISDNRGILQNGYQIQGSIDDTFQSTLWDTGPVKSDQSIHVAYSGPELKSRTRYYFRVRIQDNKGNDSGWSDAAYWETGLLGAEEWMAEWIKPAIDSEVMQEASPMLRRTFEVKGEVKAARIYATALGLYELHLNGSRAGDCLFTPGWTSYRNRLQYQTYDVTGMIKSGNNAIGAILGKGWFKGNIGWGGGYDFYGDSQALLLQMHILYEDGKEEMLISDTGWKSSAGPILMSEIYHGETYDARLEKKGWSLPDYDSTGWQGVEVYSYSKDTLTAQENVPVRIIQEIKPISIIKTPAGETVMDFGQNMTGWVRFSVEGPAGTVVTLKHAEVLDSQGNFYTENLRSAKQMIKYTLKGEGVEYFEPHFTFQGFRYICVEGYPGEILTEHFIGRVIHSEMEKTGSFECSNELVNQLQHNILWGQKGNFLDVPTDCPQRDERLGWTGDAQMFIRTACFNMNTAPFFTKWLRDLHAEQSLDNGVPFVVPNVLDDKSFSSSAWGDAATICPWTIYLCYGDERILEQQYESMKMWVEYIRNQGDSPYLWNTGFHFGDWLGLDSKPDSYIGATSTDFIATAFYAYSTNILVKTARVLGKQQDVVLYEVLYANILEHFGKEFVTPNGRLTVETQTAHVLALMFDLVEEKYRKRTVETLARLIKDNKNHLTTGFVGTPYLCHVLSNNGYNDLAYELLQQTDYPSWLYQITKGATTIWEHWDGIREDGSFWSRDMNSFNHYAYGAIGDWLYRVVAGLDTDQEHPGYRHINIRPHTGNGLTFARASLQSMYGEIRSEWDTTSTEMKLQVAIPANTTATVILPGAVLENVREEGRRLEGLEGVSRYEQIDGGVRLELGSGTYKFVYEIYKLQK